MTTRKITSIFHQMKQGEDLTKILPNATSKEYYFFIKAYKLVDISNFSNYCQKHKKEGRITDFHQMLIDIIDQHYPPLKYCHELKDGYIGLETYVNIAKGVFNV